MRVPHTGFALLGSQVPLDHDSTTVRTLALEDNVADLDGTLFARLTNLKDWLGRLGIAEAGGDKQRPDLTDDLDDLWHLDGVADDVCAMVEVCDLAILNAVEELLNTLGVIRFAVTLATERLGRLELRCGNILILGLGTTKDVSIGVKQ